jgi:hypothetical protein
VADPTDSETNSDANAQNDSDSDGDVGQSTGSMFAPRWVLRDGDGELVEAIVTPGFDPRDTRDGVESIDELRCFSVQSLGSQLLRGNFELQTGDLGPCLFEAFGSYVDSSCSEYLFGSRAQMAVDSNGIPLVAGDRLREAQIYRRTPDGDCIENTDFRASGWRSVPAPSQIRDAFSNPPYSISAEY